MSPRKPNVGAGVGKPGLIKDGDYVLISKDEWRYLLSRIDDLEERINRVERKV